MNSAICIEIDEFCSTIDGFCIQNDGFCIQNDGFWYKHQGCKKRSSRSVFNGRILISYFEESWFPILKNPDLLLKDLDFIIQTGLPRLGYVRYWELQYKLNRPIVSIENSERMDDGPLNIDDFWLKNGPFILQFEIWWCARGGRTPFFTAWKGTPLWSQTSARAGQFLTEESWFPSEECRFYIEKWLIL